MAEKCLVPMVSLKDPYLSLEGVFSLSGCCLCGRNFPESLLGHDCFCLESELKMDLPIVANVLLSQNNQTVAQGHSCLITHTQYRVAFTYILTLFYVSMFIR